MTNAVRRVAGGLRGTAFLRFCAVGAAGFCVDAGVLWMLVDAGSLGAVAARFVSFPVAVLATFELNRRWTFTDSGARSYGRALAAYLAVQGLGFLCNLVVYTILYVTLSPPLNRPLPCLAVAAALALLVNFAGSRLVVFRRGTV